MKQIYKKIFSIAFAFTACSLLSVHANSRDLMTVLQQALENDSQWAAKVHGYNSSKEIVKKLSAGIRPTISFNAQTSQESYESEVFGEDDYDASRYGATLVQPIIRLDRWHEYKKGKAVNQQIDADFQFEEQAFYMRIIKIYLDVLRAEENLNFRNAERLAIERQLKKAEQRFKVGIIADTDVQEVKAAYDISSVEYIVAEQNQDLALENLYTVTLTYSRDVTSLKADMPVEAPMPDDLDAWTALALDKNFEIISARFAKKAADKEQRSKRAVHYPTLDFVGDYKDTDRFVTTTEGELQSSSIALKLEVPIYQGGGVAASRKQAEELYLQSSEEYNFIKRETRQNTRNLYRVVKTDVARVFAQKQSIHSAKVALKATEAGYDVGTRTPIDVLASQRVLYSAKRDYANARFDYIFDLLSLKQIAGVLVKDDVLEVNSWLESTALEEPELNESELSEPKAQ